MFISLSQTVAALALFFFVLSKIRKEIPFRWANVWKGALTILFVRIGMMGHFVSPQAFVNLISPFFPLREFAVYATGVLEIAFAVLLWTRWEHETGWAIFWYLGIVIFFNIYGWTIETNRPNYITSPYYLYQRVPLQFVYMAFTYFGTRRRKATDPSPVLSAA